MKEQHKKKILNARLTENKKGLSERRHLHMHLHGEIFILLQVRRINMASIYNFRDRLRLKHQAVRFGVIMGTPSKKYQTQYDIYDS